MLEFKMDISVTENGFETARDRGEMEVYGTPLHKSADDLIDQYQSDVRYLESESRYAGGNYALADFRDDELTIVTSPGYNGGYIVETVEGIHVKSHLSAALEAAGPDNINLDINHFLHFVNAGYNRMPFDTMFESISRLPPGTVLRATDADWSLDWYLGENKSAPSLDEALEEACETLRGEDIVLGFSGGVDSTALACTFLEHDIDFRCATFNVGPEQRGDHNRALGVAEELGLETEIVEHHRPHSKEVWPHVEDRMRKDMYIPHFAGTSIIGSMTSEDEVIVSGLTLDSQSMFNLNDDRDYWHRPIAEHLVDSPLQGMGRLLKSLPHAQYTNGYVENSLFRRLFLNLVPRLEAVTNPIVEQGWDALIPSYERNLRKLRADDHYDVSDDAFTDVFKGHLSANLPNVTVEGGPDIRPFNLDQHDQEPLQRVFDNRYLTEQLAAFDEVCSLEPTLKSLRRLLYVYECQNSISYWNTFKTPSGSSFVLPAAWGPISSYYFQRERGMTDALYHKRELTKIFTPWLDTSYEKLLGPDSREPWDTPKESVFLDAKIEYFEQDTSNILSHLDGDERAVASDIYEYWEGRISENEFRHEYELEIPLRLLNLELVLDEATV